MTNKITYTFTESKNPELAGKTFTGLPAWHGKGVRVVKFDHKMNDGTDLIVSVNGPKGLAEIVDAWENSRQKSMAESLKKARDYDNLQNEGFSDGFNPHNDSLERD